MAVPKKRAFALALSLENASSHPHFDRVAVRTPRRTFATFAVRGEDVNFAFDLPLQERFCALAPEAIAPVEGGWGRMGWTSCDLTKIDAATYKEALLAAHARSNVPRTKKKAVKRASGEKAPRAGSLSTKAARPSPNSKKATKRRRPS